MKTFKSYGVLISLLVLFLGVGSLFTLTSADVKKASPNRFEFTGDTLDSLETIVFTVPQYTKNKFGYCFQLYSYELSGDMGGNAIIWESCFDTENRWFPVDTVAFTATGNVYIEGVTRAHRIKLEVQTDSTGQSGIHHAAVQLTEEF